MRSINVKIVLIFVLLSNTLPVLGLSRAAQSTARLNSRLGTTIPRAGFPRVPSYYATQKRFLATSDLKDQKSTALVPVGSSRTTSMPIVKTSQADQSLTTWIADWMRSWWGATKTGEMPIDQDQELAQKMFRFADETKKSLEQVLWDRSVMEAENKWLAAKMKAFVKELKSKYRSTITAEKDGYTVAARALLLIRDYFSAAIKNCELGDRLALAYVFSACDLLRDLRNLGVVPSANDGLIIKNIVDAIETRLMEKLSLHNLDRENLRLYLSEEATGKIMKASQLLVPIDEVQSLGEIVRTIYNTETKDQSSAQLNALLKSMDLTKDKTMAELFKQFIFLKRLYANQRFAVTDSSEKEKYKQKIVDLEKNFEKIISILSITSEYGAFLKQLLDRIRAKDSTVENGLNEMLIEGYSPEKGGSNIKDFGQHIRKWDDREQQREQEMRRWYRPAKDVVAGEKE